MTTQNTSRPQLSCSTPPNLAEVARLILEDVALPPTQRRDIVSSLNRLAKAAGRMPEAIPADPATIRDLIANKTAAMVGISPGRWNNVRSHVCLALLTLKVITIPNRIDVPPSAAWAALLKPITAKGPATVLGRFARCCTRIGIEPSQVDDAFMGRYRDDLMHRSLILEPATKFRATVLAWNAAASSIRGWPPIQLTVPDNSLYYTPGWDTYPASLVADVDRWLSGKSGCDLFAALASRARLRPATIKSHRTHLRLLLGGMVLGGEDPALLVDLAAVVTHERVMKSCTYHLERDGNQRRHVNARIASLATAIGKHHLKLTGEPLAQLQRISQALAMPKRGMTDRNKARLRAMDDAGRTDALIGLPLFMAAEVDQAVKRRSGTSTPTLALKYQTALALEVALTRCWRIKNLGGLTIGKDLLLCPDGRVVAALDGSEVKNGAPIETVLSARLAGMIRTYLKVHRPHLADRPSDYLFPGTGTGRAKTLGALSQNIKTALTNRVGVDATTHFFRHVSGKIILDHDPTAIRTVQEHLGHKHLGTTLAFYVDRNGAASTAHYDGLIERWRAGPAAGRTALAKSAARPTSRKARK